MTYPSSKTMKKGTGYIQVKRKGDNATFQTIDVNSASVTVNEQTVSITLNKLDYSTEYYILMDMGAILDSGNNEYGIASDSIWSFKTKVETDRTPPTVSAFWPSNGGTLGQLRGNLAISFNENVYAGSGSFTIYQGAAPICTIPANSPAITGYGSATITISPTVGLCPVFSNNTSYSVTISNLAVHDAAGNNYAGISGWTFKVVEDLSAPEIVTLTPASGVINVKPDVGTLSIKFNKAVKLAAEAKARIKVLSGSSSGSILGEVPLSVASDDPTVVYLNSVPALSAATQYAVYIDSGLIMDTTNSNVFPGILNDYRWSFQTLGSDKTAPRFASAAMDGMSVVLTYNEDLDPTSTPAPANFYVAVNDVAAQVTGVTVSGKQVWLKLQNSVAVGQKVTVAYTAGELPLRDLSGNAAANLASTNVSNTTNTTIPKPSSGSISGSVLTLNFNKTLNDLPSNAASQFTVKFDNNAVSIQTIALTGSSITFALGATPSSSQSVSVSYTPSSTPIQDKSGNAVAAFTNFYVTNGIDTVAPALSTATVANNIVTLYFNEGLNASSIPPKSSFSVVVNNSAATISSIAIDNNAVIITLAQAVSSGTVLVTYIPGTTPLKDLAGNAAGLISNYSVTAGGTAAKFSSGTYAGSTITLNFSSNLSSSYIPYQSQFMVKVGNATATVTSVQVSGSTLTLTLASSIPSGQAVSVAYSSSGNSLKDSLGLTVASFGPVTLTGSSTGGLESYLEKNSEGGLTFSLSGATTATDTLPSGNATVRYLLNADYLTNALTQLKKGTDITKLQLNFVVPTSQAGAMVGLPLQSLINGMVLNPDAVIRVDYGSYQFEYPLLALSSGSLNQVLASDPSAYLLIQIDRGSDANLTTAINSQGATVLTPLMDFTAYTVANGAKTEVKAYDNFVTRSFTVSNVASYKDSNLSVVRYDSDSGALAYTPTTIARNGSSAKLSFERKGNSKYAVVYYGKVFSDVTAAWAKDSVNNLASKIIISGTSATQFQPNQNITRADFAKYIVKGLGLDGQKSAAARFSDVGTTNAYASYIGAASAAGIVQGGTDGRFQPTAFITREEMATMMQRAIAYVGSSVSVRGTELTPFTDSGKISSYAKTAVQQNIAAGIMNGVSSYQFKPKDNASRAQAAVMIERMLKYVGFLQV
ncbi:SwmB domain-containing protein [Cohnella thailandensis]|nr:SwmB domain-containing protein [Cohnella thailandensis]